MQKPSGSLSAHLPRGKPQGNPKRKPGESSEEAIFLPLATALAAPLHTERYAYLRERLTELAWGFVTPFAKALLAEIAASQDITVQLLFAIATQGRLTREKVTAEITAAAHEAKFEEAEELLKCAYNRTGRVHLPISYSAAKGERR